MGTCGSGSCSRPVIGRDDALMQRNRTMSMASTDRTLHPVQLPADWAPASLARASGDAAAGLSGCRMRSHRRCSELHALPPLVTSWEILTLKQQLAEAQEGKRFLLQGGDCAESFDDCTSAVISNRLKVLLQMSLVLVHGLRLPVVRVGRFAGQYAKPRSTDTETSDGVTLPSYRGDIVNGAGIHRRRRARPIRGA